MPIHKNAHTKAFIDLKFSGDAYVGQSNESYENIRIDDFAEDLYSSGTGDVVLGTIDTNVVNGTINISLGTGLVTAENRRDNFLTNEATITGAGTSAGIWSNGGTEIIDGVTYYVASWSQSTGTELTNPHPVINNNKPGFLLVFTDTSRNINNSPGNNTNVIERATSSTYAGFLSLYILDDNIIPDPFDEDTRFFNNQLIYGPSISGSTATYFTDPSWIGKVLYKTDESDSISGVRTWKVTVGIFSEADYQRLLLAADAQNSSNSLNNAAIIQEISYSPNERADTELHVLDAITSANDGYTAFGHCTEEDISGDVNNGELTETFNSMSVNLTSVDNTSGNDIRIVNIPQDAISSTLPTLGTQIRILNFSSDSVAVNTGSGIIFVRVDFNTHTTVLAKLTAAAALISAYKLNGVDLTCAASGTNDNATIQFLPRNTTIDWTGVTIDGASDWTATVTTGVLDVFTPILLSLALDTNRIGTRTGITFIDDTYVSRTTDYGTLPNLTFARGSSLTLSNGFTLNIGKGYDFTGDAKDLTITLEDNAKLIMSGQAKENCWGGKITKDSGGNNVTIAKVATAENPVTVIQRTSGALVMNCDTSLSAPVVGDRTFLYGQSGSQLDGSLQWIVDNGSTGFYNSKGFAYVYTMPGSKVNQSFTFNSPTGTHIYVPSVKIKQFTGDTIVVGDNNNLFQFSPPYSGTNQTDVLAYEYSSIWLVIGMELSGNLPETITLYNPAVNCLMIDTIFNDKVYTGAMDFTSRPTNSKGIGATARLWNPSWTYSNEPLTKLIESYYYGLGISGATLVVVKEGLEAGAIGSIGSNNHPFNDAISISSTKGLADVSIDGEGINNYKSDNNGAEAGFGNTLNDRDGLVLMNSRGETPNATELENVKLTGTIQDTDWFCHSRRDGFRPRIITNPFSGSLSSYQPITQMEPFLDIYWQATTVADIDLLSAAIEASAHSVSTGSNMKCNLINSGNWNDNYRKIEHADNYGELVGGTDRPYDSTNNINGIFRRLINIDIPVTSEGLMSLTQGPFEMLLGFNQTVSTDANSIPGIYTGSQNQTYTNTSGSSRAFKGILKTTADIIFAALNSNSAIPISNSEIYADDLKITSVANAGDIPLDNVKIDVTSLTLGGPYASQTESASASYAISNSEVKVSSNTSFTHDLDNVVVDSSNTLTFTGDSVEDLTVIDAATVIMNTDDVDSRLGLSSNKVDTVTWGSNKTPVDPIVHASGTIILPDAITTGVFNSDTSVTGVNAAIESTTPILTITGTLSGDSKVSNVSDTATIGELDGARINLASGADAIITNITDGQIVGADKTATVITTHQILDGNFDTVTFESMPTTTISTRHTGASNDCNFEMTNSGAVEFANDATGSGNIVIKGPPNVIEREYYDLTSNYFKINVVNGVENSFEIKSEINEDVGGNPIANLQGNAANRFFTVDNTVFRIGAFQQDVIFSPTITEKFYTLIEEAKAANVKVRRGGIGKDGMTKVAEDGTNFTENVEFTKDPFTVNLSSTVSGGMFATKTPDGTVKFNVNQFDEADLDREEFLDVAWIKPGYKIFFQSFQIENQDSLGENGVQSIVITPIEEAFPISETVRNGTEVISVKFNQTPFAGSNFLVTDVNNAIQKFKQMNKIQIEAVMTSQETLKAVLHYESNDIFGSDGEASSSNGNPNRYRMTSMTAAGASTKETTAYIRPTTILGTDSETQIEDKVKMFVFLDLPLAIATEPPRGIDRSDISAVLDEKGLSLDNVRRIADKARNFEEPTTT